MGVRGRMGSVVYAARGRDARVFATERPPDEELAERLVEGPNVVRSADGCCFVRRKKNIIRGREEIAAARSRRG